eukprot:gene9797-1531_t
MLIFPYALGLIALAALASAAPLKVFILVGQSNMQGQGNVGGKGKSGGFSNGTLENAVTDPRTRSEY